VTEEKSLRKGLDINKQSTVLNFYQNYEQKKQCFDSVPSALAFALVIEKKEEGHATSLKTAEGRIISSAAFRRLLRKYSIYKADNRPDSIFRPFSICS